MSITNTPIVFYVGFQPPYLVANNLKDLKHELKTDDLVITDAYIGDANDDILESLADCDSDQDIRETLSEYNLYFKDVDSIDDLESFNISHGLAPNTYLTEFEKEIEDELKNQVYDQYNKTRVQKFTKHTGGTNMQNKEQNIKLIKEKLMNSKLMKEYAQVIYPEVNVDYDLIHDTLRLSTGSSDYSKSVTKTNPEEFEKFIDEILDNIKADLD